MLKNRVVASFVGNFSPVKRRRAIFVRSLRHRRGDIGDALKRRACLSELFVPSIRLSRHTFLKDRCPIHLQQRLLGVLVLLCVAHGRL